MLLHVIKFVCTLSSPVTSVHLIEDIHTLMQQSLALASEVADAKTILHLSPYAHTHFILTLYLSRMTRLAEGPEMISAFLNII